MDEAELQVADVLVVSQTIVSWCDRVDASVGQLLFKNVDELKLRSDCAFSITVQRNSDLRVEVRGKIGAVPGDFDLGWITLVHVLRLKEDSVGGGGRRLNEVLSPPLVGLGADSNLESNVALNEQRWLDANGSVGVDECADDFDGVEAARDTIRWKEARSGDVDNCSAQHVAGLRREY